MLLFSLPSASATLRPKQDYSPMLQDKRALAADSGQQAEKENELALLPTCKEIAELWD